MPFEFLESGLLGWTRGLRLASGRLAEGLAVHFQQFDEDLGVGHPAEAVLSGAHHRGELAAQRSAVEDDFVQQSRLHRVFGDLEALGVAPCAFGDRGDRLDVGVDFSGLGRGVGVGFGAPDFGDALSGIEHGEAPCWPFSGMSWPAAAMGSLCGRHSAGGVVLGFSVVRAASG